MNEDAGVGVLELGPVATDVYGGAWNGPIFVLTHHPEDATPTDGVTFLNCDPAEAVAQYQAANADATTLSGRRRGAVRWSGCTKEIDVKARHLPVLPWCCPNATAVGVLLVLSLVVAVFGVGLARGVGRLTWLYQATSAVPSLCPSNGGRRRGVTSCLVRVSEGDEHPVPQRAALAGKACGRSLNHHLSCTPDDTYSSCSGPDTVIKLVVPPQPSVQPLSAGRCWTCVPTTCARWSAS